MSDCCHKDTYQVPEQWPTGDEIEVCNCCGMSRTSWPHVSPWLQVDIVAARQRVQGIIDRILRSVRAAPYSN